MVDFITSLNPSDQLTFFGMLGGFVAWIIHVRGERKWQKYITAKIEQSTLSKDPINLNINLDQGDNK